MASLNCSELQFAFTFFAKFNQRYNFAFSNIVVPSTIMEGTDSYTYNGADLVLDNFFIQFKMAELLMRTNALEFKNHKNPTPPYFRFDVKNLPAPTSSGLFGQLDYLISHSKDPNKNVFYVSASFDHKTYSKDIGNKNFWYKAFYTSSGTDLDKFCSFVTIKDTMYPNLTKTDDHVICYKHGANDGYFLSEPEKIRKVTSNDFLAKLNNPELELSHFKTLEDTLNELEGDLKEREIWTDSKDGTLRPPEEDLKDNKILPDDANQRLSRIKRMQTILLTHMNIFWSPIVLPLSEVRNRRIDQILKK